jgi:hypothetical protein
LAQIFTTENVYQLFNAGVSGVPVEAVGELVRIFDLRPFGNAGKQTLQVNKKIYKV